MSMRLTDKLPERDDVERLRKRYAELTSIAAGLIKECWRLQTDNDDLRGSSRAWMNLYVRQLERANALEQQLLSGPRRV